MRFTLGFSPHPHPHTIHALPTNAMLVIKRYAVSERREEGEREQREGESESGREQWRRWKNASEFRNKLKWNLRNQKKKSWIRKRGGGRGSCDAIKLVADGIQTSVASATKAKETKEQRNVARRGKGRRSKWGSKWKGGKCFKLRAS